MTQVLHERTIRLIPILMLLTAMAVVVPAMAVPPSYEGVELLEIGTNTFDVRLTFNESVAWATELTGTHLTVEVEREGAVTLRDIDSVSSRKAKDSAPTMDVGVLGGLREYDTVTVSLTATGAGAVYSLDDDGDKHNPESVGQSFTYVLPPEFVNATTNIDGDEIIIEFDKTMDDPVGKHDEFNFTIAVGGEKFAFTEASLVSDDDMKIVLTCEKEIAFGDVVNVSYVKGTVTSDNGDGKLQSFADMKVYNFVPEVPVALYANTTTDGNTINITFSKEMTDPAGKHDQFTFFVNDNEVGDFSAVNRNTGNLTFSLTIDEDALIAAGDVVNVSYSGDIRSEDDGKLASFENLTVENNVPASPKVVATKMSKDGDQIIVTFDKDMVANPIGNLGQFTYRVNDGDEEVFYWIERQDGDNATFVLYNRFNLFGSLFGSRFESSDAVTLTYVRGTVRSDDQGVLQNFTNVSVENVMPPEFVQIDPITADSAATKTVTLNFSKPVWWESPLRDGPTNAIVVEVDGDTRVVTEIGPRSYADASNLLDVTFSGPAIGDEQLVTVKITDCGSKKIKETSSENNTMNGEDWQMRSYVLPPTIREQDPVTFKPECGGTNIDLYFSKYVWWNTNLNGTHITVTVDGEPVGFADVAPQWWSDMMTLELSRPITEDGQEVVITITDAGAAEIMETTEGVPMAGEASVKAIYAAPPEFEKILVTDAEMGEVTLYFSKPVFAQGLSKTNDVKAMINGDYWPIDTITAPNSREDAENTIVVKLYNLRITEGQVVEISVTASGAGKIKETAGGVKMLGGNTRSVTHTAATKPVFVGAWTNEFGTAIIAEFDRNITKDNLFGGANGFGFVVNDEEKTFWFCNQDGDNKERLILSIAWSDTIKTGDVVNLTYTPGSVASEDGGLLAAFDERIVNKKRPSLTGIVVTKVAGDGNEVKLLFDEPVYWDETLVGGLDIKATVAGGARNVVDLESRTVEDATDELTVTVKGAAITEGQSVAITVTKSGADKILSNGKPLIECTTSTQYKVYHGAPYITDISLISHVEKEVCLDFSDYVSWEDLVNGTHIIVEVDGEARRVYKVDAVKEQDRTIGRDHLDIRFDGDIIKVGQKIVVTITEEGAEAISSDHGTLAPPYVIEMTFTKPTGPVIETVETNEYGNLVYITFDKAIAWASPVGFELYLHEWWSVGFKNAWLENEGRTLVLEVDNEHDHHQLWPQMIEPGDEFAISYHDGYIYSDDEIGELADFEKHPVENKVTKTFDQIQPLDCSWTLVSTNQWIDPTASEFVNADLIYKYDAATGTFSSATVKDVKPVEALYVKTTEGGWFAANFADFQPLSTKKLYAGWNLISVGTCADANALLSPLRFIQVGQVEGTGITTLVSQSALNRITWRDMYLPTLTDNDWEELECADLCPVDGYWVYMNGEKDFGVLPGEWGDHIGLVV